MDNNFNQQAPQQPVYQQAPQQMPQQQMYQQAPQQQMYQQPMYQPAPKKPSNINTMELLALILSSVGAFMAILGSILTCSCSASASWDYKRYTKFDGKDIDYNLHKMSLVVLVAIIGAIIAVVGVVLAILALKQKDAAVKAGKLSYIAIAVGAFGVVYGILPMLTICGYNCSLDAQYKKLYK